MQKEVKIVISVDKKTGALKMVQKEFDTTKSKVLNADGSVQRFIQNLKNIATATVGVYAVKKAFEATVGVGFKFVSSMEDARIGIASLIAVNAKVPAGMNKFQISMQASKEVMEELKKANEQTAATLPQLITGFQATLAPALKAGFSLKETVKYTKLMTIAAKAMQVPLDQLPQELKSIVSGTIDVNSVVATNLGITNEQIKLHKKQGNLYEFLTKKLQDFQAAGEASNNTLSTIQSNISDHWLDLWGSVVESSGAFDGVKKALLEVDKQLSKIGKDKDNIEVLGESGRIVFSILAQGVAMLVKSFGGILMVLDTLKAGWNEWGEAGKIAINYVKIKLLEFQRAFWKSINVFGTADKKIKELTNRIRKLTRENYKHKISIVKIDAENRKFVKGVDKIAKQVSKMADSFSKNYKNKISKSAKKTTKDIKGNWKNLLTFQKNSTKKTNEQIKKEAEKLAKQKEKIEDDILGKIKRNADEEYKYRLQKLNSWKSSKKAQIEKLIKDEDEKKTALENLDKAYYSQKAKLEEDLTKKHQAELQKRVDALNKTFGVEQSLSDNFYKVFTGKTKSASDFFKSFTQSIMDNFAKAVADIAAKKIVMSFMNKWANGAKDGQGFVEKFLGIDIPFLKFAKGTIWGSGRYGVVPGNAPYSGDDYRNDKIPALIAPGEAVIPRSAVEANRNLVEKLIVGSRVGLFAKGVINNPYVQQEQFRAEDGVYGFKGGVIGKIGKELEHGGKKVYHEGKNFVHKVGKVGEVVWDGVKDLGSGAWSVVKGIGKGLWDGIKGVVKPLLKNPELGWLAQIAVGALNPALIPAMLNADLMSGGLTLATGGNLKDAFKGAGLSGLVAGAGTAVSSLIKTGTLPTTNQGFWEAVKTYPDELWKDITTKYDTLKEGLSKLGDGSAFDGVNADKFPSVKEGFFKIGDYVQTLGKEAFNYLTDYLKNPEKIFQYILDHLSDILTNVATTITGTLSNPFVASLATKSLLDKKHPLGVKGEIKQFGEGGLVHRRMIAEVAEKGEPELITPLSRVGDIFDSKAIVDRLERVEKLLFQMYLIEDKHYRFVKANS